jgi:ribonucleoside-diphosphate reductase alpha chain
LDELPEAVRAVYRTAWEVPMRSLIDMAADRGAFIDQSQSLNLFIENPNIGQLSSMYFYAWKKGLKTTYYLRSRPATRIAKATVDTPSPSHPPARSEADPHATHGYTPVPPAVAPVDDAAVIACSLENPESCEACQ